MKIEAHRAKAQSIERSLAQCTVDDYETIIEGAMLAGTHWFNILLHRAGLRDTDNDIVHAEFVSIGERRKFALAVPQALSSLDAIERLRTSHVRGDMPRGDHAARLALEYLSQLHAACLAGAGSPVPFNTAA